MVTQHPSIEPNYPATYRVPKNGIIMWSGTIATIPSGWVICDGNNGTPNLLNRFIKSVVNASTNPGTTGGAATHTHAGHDTHATHSTHIDHPIGGTADDSGTATVGYPFQNNHAAKSHDAHDAHDAHSAHDTPNSEPAYYALAFIMKT
jgi:hypothetical protein